MSTKLIANAVVEAAISGRHEDTRAALKSLLDAHASAAIATIGEENIVFQEIDDGSIDPNDLDDDSLSPEEVEDEADEVQ